MALKYQATVTAIGELVGDFLAEGIVVLFGENAPEELAEFAILHDGTELHAPLEVGDMVCFGSACAQILAVGDVASDNLRNLGHLVLKFNGESEIEMPGDVCVEKIGIPAITVGTVLTVSGAKDG